MTDLPVNIDATYADDGSDASVKAHQEHHDALHALYNFLYGATPDPSAAGVAPLSSPEFTDTPTAPTASAGTNSTQIATTAFVQTEITDLGNPLTQIGNLVTLIYDGTSARWEFPDGTVPTLTGRTASIMWEGTAAQMPAQGTGDSNFKVGDKAAIRSTGYTS